MEHTKLPRATAQAFEWLDKMGIEVAPATGSDGMYAFKYNGSLMFISTNSDDNELEIFAPVFLRGKTNKENKEIFNTAKQETINELNEYIVEYVTDILSIVGQIYVRPKHIRCLRRYQFQRMLDDVLNARKTFLLATIIATDSPEDWLE